MTNNKDLKNIKNFPYNLFDNTDIKDLQFIYQIQTIDKNILQNKIYISCIKNNYVHFIKNNKSRMLTINKFKKIHIDL